MSDAGAAAPGPASGGFAARLALARPRQWVKNLPVLAGVVFSGRFTEPGPAAEAGLAVLAFTAAAAGVYAWNDAADAAADRAVSGKRTRPVAAGLVSPTAARVQGVACAVIGLALAAACAPAYAGIVGGYLALNLAYSGGLRAIPGVDVACIAAGFVLRAWGGAVAVDVRASAWLLACTALLAGFLALAKRRQEAAAGDGAGRPALAGWTPAGLDRALAGSAVGAIAAYLAYAVAAHGPGFLATVPLVVAGFTRFGWLVRRRDAGVAPFESLLADGWLLACVVAWGAAAALCIWQGGVARGGW